MRDTMEESRMSPSGPSPPGGNNVNRYDILSMIHLVQIPGRERKLDVTV